MCGRFALATTSEELANHFNLKRKVTIAPRYNIAPSQQVVIIRPGSNAYTTAAVRWGLIPHCSKDEKVGYKLINARAESIQEKPAFRDAFKYRRCLIPSIGFYEWKQDGKRKQPYFVKMKNGNLFAMAGIWESWLSPEGQKIESCAIITTNANTIVAKLHDRMPVILPKDCYGLWLDPAREGFSFPEYLRPYDPFKMTAYPVSNMVNNVKNEGEGCIRKIEG
jgi:putative SOS response-associated peptidase YedK